MQRKRRKYNTAERIFILHSIPKLLTINSKTMLKNNVKSNVLYSIPSVVVLVFLFGLFGLFHSNGNCYALEPVLSLELSNNELSGETVNSSDSSIAIASTNVTVNVSNAENYNLILSVNNENLTNGNTTLAAGNPGDSGSDNVWGYYFGDDTNPTVYTAPSTTGQNINNLPALTNSGVSFTKNLIFAAKFSEEALAGHYSASGTLSLVATAQATTYTLTLNNNNGDGGTETKTCSTYAASCEINLSDVTAPTRAGYTFLGWNDSDSATIAQYTTNGTNSTSSIVSIASDKTVWAVWKEDTAKWSNGVDSGIIYMQDIKSGFCKNNEIISTHTSITLKDGRDGSIYSITKMSDGNCWLSNNLKITGLIEASESDFDSPNSLTLPNVASDANTEELIGYVEDNIGYYNWYSITATSGNSTITGDGVNAPSSICPRNWALPSSAEYQALYQLSGSPSFSIYKNPPYNFYHTGRLNGTSVYAKSSEGFWWSRTTGQSSTNAYYMRTANSNIYPIDTNRGRKGRYAARCISKY